MLVGLGPAAELDADTLRTAAAAVARKTERVGGTLAWLLDDSLSPPRRAGARPWSTGSSSARTTRAAGRPARAPAQPERLVLVGGDDDALREPAERRPRVAEWANRARDLANRPPNDLTPERLADRAAEIATGHANSPYEAFTGEQIRALGMGAFAAVAQGSHNPPRLIVLRYDPPGARDDVVLGLVGKAITFDTGGISIKPALYMEDMKGDMAGGAAVIEGTGAIAELGLPVRVLAVVAATENMPAAARTGPATS